MDRIWSQKVRKLREHPFSGVVLANLGVKYYKKPWRFLISDPKNPWKPYLGHIYWLRTRIHLKYPLLGVVVANLRVKPHFLYQITPIFVFITTQKIYTRAKYLVFANLSTPPPSPCILTGVYANYWNKIPPCIRDLPSYSRFKKAIRQYIYRLDLTDQ